ncbi:MAG: hypothetical protein ISS78_02990 [Phycisphaerae bacterium]|nr:hypothetical protein [Phycisphaerae bacterium]
MPEQPAQEKIELLRAVEASPLGGTEALARGAGRKARPYRDHPGKFRGTPAGQETFIFRAGASGGKAVGSSTNCPAA